MLYAGLDLSRKRLDFRSPSAPSLAGLDKATYTLTERPSPEAATTPRPAAAEQRQRRKPAKPAR